MVESWTGDLVGKMHNAGVTRQDLADHLHYCKSYITMILNGQKSPKNAKEMLTGAFNEIIAEREQ